MSTHPFRPTYPNIFFIKKNNKICMKLIKKKIKKWCVAQNKNHFHFKLLPDQMRFVGKVG